MNWNPKPLDPADVTVHRRGRGKPLILLHCLGMDWRFWDVLEPLTDQFELIAYSLPGHHDTKVPKGQYGEAELSEQLRALMKREGIAKASLAGISMGGSMAQHFAGTYPAMVDRVILCDCTPRYNDEMRTAWPQRAEIARTKGVASLIPDAREGLLHPGLARSERPQCAARQGEVGIVLGRRLCPGLRMAGPCRCARAGQEDEHARPGSCWAPTKACPSRRRRAGWPATFPAVRASSRCRRPATPRCASDPNSSSRNFASF